MARGKQKVLPSVTINSKWALGSDAGNIVLFEHGKPEFYFATVRNALKFLVEQEVKESHLVDLRGVVQRIDQFQGEVMAVLPQLQRMENNAGAIRSSETISQ
jgi:hypothetical protein